MSTQNQTTEEKQLAPLTIIKKYFAQPKIQTKFESLLGGGTKAFLGALIQIASSNDLLAKADPNTLYTAAYTSAVLNLPINPSLGLAWIVPYKGQAQFQIGWKGYVQLALRTGQYKAINVISVYENQFTKYNALTEELEADFNKVGSGKIVGYVAYFKLLSGFEKTVYWTREKVLEHAQKYSKTFGKGSTGWNNPNEFDAMALKTVLKNTLSKWGIMSIEMQTAQLADQSVQTEEGIYDYPDNENTIDVEAVEIDEREVKRISMFIDKAQTLEDLEKLDGFVNTVALRTQYEAKLKFLKSNQQIKK